MGVPDILFLTSLFVAICYFAKIGWQEKRFYFRVSAGLILILGLVLLFFKVSQFILASDGVKKTSFDNEQFESMASALELKQRSSLVVESLIFSGEKEFPEEFFKTSKRTVFVDASQGLTEKNRETLSHYFPGLKIEKTKSTEATKVCWIRSPLFPYASGVCNSRASDYVMTGGSGDLNRILGNKTTAKAAELEGQTVFLISYKLDVKDKSNEEICLSSLSHGLPCAAVEILPATATSALSLSTKDPTIQGVLEEFNVSSSKKLSESLDLYSQRMPISTKISEIKASPNILECGGLSITGDSGSLNIYELAEVHDDLKKVDSESKLAKEARKLSNYVNCPGLYQLEIPVFKKSDLRTSARSFMSHLTKNSFWFVDTKSYMNRFERIKGVRLQTDNESRNMRIASDQIVKNMAVTFVFPNQFPEELLQTINVVNATDGWRLYRIGPSSFRLSINKLNGEVFVELESFFQSLKSPRLGVKSFFDTPGVIYSLGVALILASLLTFVHTTSSRRPVVWPLTFWPVLLIQFVLIFLSFLTSRTMGFNDALFAEMDNPAIPEHFSLKEWPDEWFEKNNKLASQINSANLQRSEKWKAAWRLAEQESQKESGAQGVKVVSQENLILNKVPGNKNVVIWDHPATRNFYFRKSSFYPAMILGWREIAKKSSEVAFSSAAEFSQIEGLNQKTVLVIPDIRFLSEQDLSSVSRFVKGGGILLFSERLGEEGTDVSLKGDPDFIKTLGDAGLGHTKAAPFSIVNYEGFPIQEISINHRMISASNALIDGSAWGAGSVVFMGVMPVDSNSRGFVSEVVERLKGQSIMTSVVQKQCATAILLQPWAGTMAELTLLRKQIKTVGYDVKWLVDVKSFANMAAIWEGHFKADGVVFMDDEKESSRNIAGHLLKSMGILTEPIFAGFKKLAVSQTAGSSGNLITIRSFNSSFSKSEGQKIATECSLGFSHPRLLTPSSAGWSGALQALKAYKPMHLMGLKEYIEGLKGEASETSEKRQIYYKITNPTEYDLERK